MRTTFFGVAFITLLGGASASAQSGSAAEPLRYLGGVFVDNEVHDGRLRPAIGVASYQVMRANRSHPDMAGGFGWTYNHAPMLAWWNGKFYLEYLSNPIGEHEPPGQTLLVTSTDGRAWNKPRVVFPPYKAPAGIDSLTPPKSTGYMMHQRMGFYVARDGRLLILAFYGHAPDPFGQGGIGRVVREIHRDGTMSPIYFLRYNTGTPWNESNTGYPLYTHSADAGFRAACEALLANKLITEQWRDEDPGAAAIHGPCQALSFFHRPDGLVTGLCKSSFMSVTADEGRTWSDSVRSPSLITNNAKVWGQKTPDGRYAIVYNPVPFGSHRWPLAISVSRDGIVFDTLNLVNGEVPPRRFIGHAKDFGSQYVRGIVEGNGIPGDAALWVTYSSNKEDIWISRIPVPVRDRVEGPVRDTFDALQPGGVIPDWNIYSPKWAPVAVAEIPGGAGKALELRDKDPYDYARAIRVFPEMRAARVRCRVMPKAPGAGGLELEIGDRYGSRPVRVVFSADGWVRAANGSDSKQIRRFTPGKWVEVEIEADAGTRRFNLAIDGSAALSDAPFAEAALTLERLSLRTGPYRNQPTRALDRYDPRLKDLSGADNAVDEAIFYLDDVSVSPL